MIAWRRWLVALAALGCIALQFDGSLAFSSLALALWLLLMAWAARSQLQRLWMPRFWTFSIIVALGSGLLLGKRDLALGPIKVSRAGLEAGLLMVVRGFFLFALTSWASRLIVGEDVQRVIRRLGLRQFGNALTAAFSLLPSLSERVHPMIWAGRGTGLIVRFGRVRAAAVELICHTVRLAHSLENTPLFIAAVVGPPGSGKTTLLHQILEQLRAKQVRVGGVTQPAIHQGEERTGYRLRDVATGEEIAFARRAERGFSFAQEGWDWANKRLYQALKLADCVVLDELGRLEAQGQGHLESLALDGQTQRWWRCRTPPRMPPILLVSVREEHAEAIADRVGQFSLRVAPGASAAEIDRFIDVLKRYLC